MREAALAASDVILDVYDTSFSSEQKADGTPVTVADKRAEEIILSVLYKTGIPVLAEESAEAGSIPALGNRFFAVDPLDGTKEFIKRNGEFTVNIALIVDKKPIAGITIVPVKKEGYVGSVAGAFKFPVSDGRAGEDLPIHVAGQGPIKLVGSRSHLSVALLKKLETHLPPCENVSVGSSLKLCLLAEGKARLYPRFTPTYEWDTAAGQAILEAAGGVVYTMDGKPLGYNKFKDNYLNPFFVAADDANFGAEVAGHMKALTK